MRSHNLGFDFTLENCLFGAVGLTKNDDCDKYFYSQYGTEFDARSNFSLSDGGGFVKNIITFGADNSS